MTEPQSDATNEFAVAMMTIIEMMSPIFEAANGIRADMESQGYSKEDAATTGAVFTQEMLKMIMRKAS